MPHRILVQPASNRRWHLLVLLTCILLSGCATYIKEEFKRAELIQSSCTTIQEAIPVHVEDLTDTLFNTLSLRMLGTCGNGTIACIDPSATVEGTQTFVTSISDLRNSLEAQEAALKKTGQAPTDAALRAITALKEEFATLNKDISDKLIKVDDAQKNLRAALAKARAALQVSLDEGKKCTQRTGCMSKLSLVITREQEAIRKAGEEFRLSLEAVIELQAKAAQLAARAQDYAVQVKASSNAAVQQMSVSGALLDKALANVVSGAKVQKDRLAIGIRSIASLATGDVTAASADLLAWKVSSKAAEPLLDLIDRMLSHIDRTVERADSRVYALMSIGVTVYSSDVQKQFDEIFQTLMAEKSNKEESISGPNATYRKTNLSMKLAFASAACDRLGMGQTAAAANSSMFTPFLYATLANVRFSVAHPEADALGAAERDRLFNEFNVNSTEKTKVKRNDEFSEKITDAYVGEVANKRAPSIVQQVALCTGTEQAVETGTVTDPVLARSIGKAACGQRVLAAVSTGSTIPLAASMTTAVQVVDAHAATEAAKVGQGSAANEWSLAMQAVMASIQKTTGEYEALCKRIQSRLEAARCDSGKDGIVIDFDGTFQPASTTDKRLELSLVSVADVLSAYRRSFRVTVHGFASQKLPRCEASVPKEQQLGCAVKRNAMLADKRATWAASVLKSRMAQYFAAGSASVGQREQLSFDNAFDRRVRVSLAFAE